MNTVEQHKLVSDVIELIGTRRHWTADYFNTDAKGHGLTPGSPGAARYCVMGALLRCRYGTDFQSRGLPPFMRLLDAITKEVLPSVAVANHWPEGGHVTYWGRLVDVNNQEGHGAVLQVLRNTQKYLESQMLVEATSVRPVPEYIETAGGTT